MFNKLFFRILPAYLLVVQFAVAQCPQPASCTPGGPLPANLVFGCGITNVVFGSINRVSGLASQGYQDVSCTIGTNILVGVPSPITIITNSNIQENVRVWIDLNNDGIFGATTELVFSSNNAFTHNGVINIPLGTALDTALRMRVMAEVNGAPDAPVSNLQPCYTPLYSQVEDYRVRVLPNTQPPVALFTASDTITCTGQIQFTDQSINSPSSWSWDFGDGNTSNLQNPLHTYLPGGPFTVRLIVSSSSGVDTLVRNNYITFNSQSPIAAVCTPATSNYCCGYGITSFSLSTLSRNSGNASEGYRNFTCGQSISLTEGISYPVNVATGTLAADTRIWIDYNNNGSFSSNELVFTRTNSVNATGNIAFSDTSLVYNTPLRLRVITDFVGSAYTACGGIVHGQAEDYTVIIAQNVAAPVANFTSNFSNACNPIVQFTNTSLNAITSYLWRFGDGNTSTLQNPQHTYTTPGTYSVTLIVSSPFGVDSITRSNLINFAGTVTAPACTPTTNGTNGGVGITRFRFGTIDRTSPGATEGYSNQVCNFITEVTEGQTYQVIVNTGPNFPENVRMWIDYNGNGAYITNEQVFNSTGSTVHTGTITISTNSVKNQLLRIRVVSSFNSINTGTGCGTLQFGQGEDYGIIIRPNNIPPITNFSTTDLNPCNGGVRLTNTTFGNVTSYKWFFGDGDSSSLAQPVKYYTNPGIYTISLTACNAFGCSTLTRTNYVNVGPIVAPRYASCASGASYSCCSVGIASVTIGNMSNTSGNGTEGNRDFTCTRIVTDTVGKPINVSIQNSNSSIPEDVAIWIDLNNDQVLDTSERVYLSTSKINHTDSFSINGFVVTNTPLLMRIVSRQAGTSGVLSPCGALF
jgi:PKD repeat protein